LGLGHGSDPKIYLHFSSNHTLSKDGDDTTIPLVTPVPFPFFRFATRHNPSFVLAPIPLCLASITQVGALGRTVSPSVKDYKPTIHDPPSGGHTNTLSSSPSGEEDSIQPGSFPSQEHASFLFYLEGL
jgi:hypothetical protein